MVERGVCVLGGGAFYSTLILSQIKSTPASKASSSLQQYSIKCSFTNVYGHIQLFPSSRFLFHPEENKRVS